MARFFECFHFSFEQGRVKYHAIADYVYFIALKNTGRNGPKDILFAVKLQCMTSVRATLKTGNEIVSGSENVNNFPFSLVAPLESQ